MQSFKLINGSVAILLGVLLVALVFGQVIGQMGA